MKAMTSNINYWGRESKPTLHFFSSENNETNGRL